MELLPAEVRIVDLVEIPLTSLRLYFLSFFATCMAQLIPNANPILFAHFLTTNTLFRSGVINSSQPSGFCQASVSLLPNAVFPLLRMLCHVPYVCRPGRCLYFR